MIALRTDGIDGERLPRGDSPFHVLMAAKLERDGVLRRTGDGRYLAAVRPEDVASVMALPGAAAGRVSLLPCDDIHLVGLSSLADVIDADTRCGLLVFPEDFREPAIPAAETAAPPVHRIEPESAPLPAPSRTGAASIDHAAAPRAGAPDLPQGAENAVDDLVREIEAALRPALVAEPPGLSSLRAQFARDIPEIERLMRDAARAGPAT